MFSTSRELTSSVHGLTPPGCTCETLIDDEASFEQSNLGGLAAARKMFTKVTLHELWLLLSRSVLSGKEVRTNSYF